MSPSVRATVFSLGLAGLLTPAPDAQVVQWRIVKGPFYEQTADDTQPTAPLDHSVCAFVTTTAPGDATSITISGGGIVGSLPFEQEGTEWFLENDFADAAAMNALFPSSTTYTLTLSGGTLGTLVQTAAFQAEQYPNTPYLTGTTWTESQSVDATSPFSLSWNHPGPLTDTSGVTIFELYSPAFADSSFLFFFSGAATGTTIPAFELDGLHEYEGFLEYTHASPISGAGGFGVAGVTSHNVGLDFAFTTDDTGCQQDLGSGGPGDSELVVCGEGLDSGQTSIFTLKFAEPGGNAFILVSLPGGANVSAKGGTLLSAGNLLPGFPLVLPVGGDGIVDFDIPGGGGPLSVIAQVASTDASQPFGVEISNAVSLAFGP